MLRTLAVVLALFVTASAGFAQKPPPSLDSGAFRITDSNGHDLINPRSGEVMKPTITFTVSGIGTYHGKVTLNGKVVEEICVTEIFTGQYIYENKIKKTWGYFKWNPAGYFEHWSSWGGGTTRRLYPPVKPPAPVPGDK